MLESAQILNTALLLAAIVVGAFLASVWLRDRRRQAEDEKANRERQAQFLEEERKERSRLAEEERELRERQLRQQEDLMYEQRRMQERIIEEQQQRLEEYEKRRGEELKHQEKIAEQQSAGAGTGGYIFLDLPDDQRPLFHDLLKGFEEYAQLKGYQVYFSIDATYTHKIAFKFTLANDVINVSPEKVKADFREYIDKVQHGEPIEDLPIVLSVEDHNLLLATMKNRINFLQHNYNLKKNAVEFYEGMLNNFSASRLLPAPSVVVQTGGSMDSRNYNATNSSRLIQGESNEYADNSVDASIRIANSFNERKNQIESIARLIEILKADEQLATSHKERAITNLEKVSDELSDEEQPDKSRVKKWLEKAKTSLELLKLGKAGVETAIEVYKSFGFPDISSLNLPGIS
ncbi:MAG TPA: hypothetical protein VGO56_03695 [Pyrinomonadaceae bacterium]|jgi:hypothetical protein|nr:hypothetical protein [Pyrinomonadaceae bacterium]